MIDKLNPPKVFISYSHSSVERKNWVIKLAEKLFSFGVYAHLDIWELKPGNDVIEYIERAVESNGIDKILVICDSFYKDKADGRKGGVGVETQLISKEVYNNVNQNKFIPVVCEFDDKGEPYVPVYLKGRMYIDFSKEENFEENFKELLKSIFGIPLYEKPYLGEPPAFISEKIMDYKDVPINSIIKGQALQLYWYGQDKKRYIFPTNETYRTWFPIGLKKKIYEIPNEVLDNIPIAGNVTYKPGTQLIKISTDEKIFAVASGGCLRWISSPLIAYQIFGPDWITLIDVIPDVFFVNYFIGEDIKASQEYDPARERENAILPG